MNELAEKLGFGYLFIKKKVEELRRPAEASQRSGKKPQSILRKKHATQLLTIAETLSS